MEVINCLYSSSSPRTSIKIPSRKIHSQKKASSIAIAQRSPAFQRYSVYSARSIFQIIKGRIELTIKSTKFHVISISKYWWIIASLIFMTFLPIVIIKSIARSESYFKPVVWADFDETAEIKFIDSLMNKFAMEESAHFDSDGNIINFNGDDSVSTANIFKQPVQFSTYTIKNGDTISSISKKFGLKNISTLIAINSIDNARNLYSGKKILIPNMDGLNHIIQPNETISSIAKKYGISTTDLVDVNDLESEILTSGDKLFIPGARMASAQLEKAMGEVFLKPIRDTYILSSKFGRRNDPKTGVLSNHTGIDMACPKGTPIYAAKSGKVSYTGFSRIYGNYVIVTHSDGYQTWYAHMDKIIAKKGDLVSQNSKLGLVGNTGYSTGPHLHFSVYKNTKLVDPLTLIK